MEALAATLNKSADRLQTLWFTFLSVSLYFMLAVGTTTHRMLLLEEGLSLPLVNVKLPLLGFYAIGPAFYVAFHAYFLMMLVLLARTAKTFVATLNEVLPEDSKPLEHERFRMRIENALFLQIIVGARREREGPNGRILRGLALLSLAVVPVLLLLAFQLMFLPYHWELMTWWHRGMVMLDLLLVWTLWPSYRRHWGERMAPDWCVWTWDTTRLLVRRALASARAIRWPPAINWALLRMGLGTRRATKRATGFGWAAVKRWRARFPSTWGEVAPFPRWQIPKAGVSAVVLVFSLAMATFPDERVHANRVAAAIDEAGRRVVVSAGYRLPPPHERRFFILDGDDREEVRYDGYRLSAWLFGWEMPIGIATVDKRGWFPNRLWLPNEDFVDDEKLKRLLADNTKSESRETKREAYSVDLRGRDLTGAMLDDADLQNADLKEARISQASFRNAWLQNARLEVLDSSGASLMNAKLQGASLRKSELQYTWLEGADLQGVSLDWAKLEGASLIRAQLQGAKLFWTKLQGASLHYANLQGAQLLGAELQGALLDGAEFQGASLSKAELKGASLKGAKLQCAILDQAQLQGAFLYGAQLQGAWLFKAELQGASLDEAQLQGASFEGAQLEGASLVRAQVWRAMEQPLDATLLSLYHLEHASVPERKIEWEDFSSWFLRILDFNSWRQAITDLIPAGYHRDRAIERLEILKPSTTPPEDLIPRDFWEEAEARGAAAMPREFADFLVTLACAGGNGAPHVARGLIRNGRLRAAGSFLPVVVDRLARSRPGTKNHDPTACPGTAGFTDADWKQLDIVIQVGKVSPVPEPAGTHLRRPRR